MHKKSECVGRVDPVFHTQVVERLTLACSGRTVAGQHSVDESSREGWLPNEAVGTWRKHGAIPRPPLQELCATEYLPIVARRVGELHGIAVATDHHHEMTASIFSRWPADDHRRPFIRRCNHLVKRARVAP